MDGASAIRKQPDDLWIRRWLFGSRYDARMRAAATYANALTGAVLTPSLLVAKDLHGYSYDGTFSKGRSAVRIGLRADWGKAYFADIQFTRFGGGNYNLLVDRSNVMIAAGATF